MYGKLTFLILFGALVLRLVAGFWWQQRLPEGQDFAFPDSMAYWELAHRIAGGEPYAMNPDRRVFRTPGYPVLLSSLVLLAGDRPPVAWARALNAGLGTLAVIGVMVLARMLFDDRTALAAGTIAAIYPSAISMSTLVLTEAPFCPLMLFHLILWVLAWRASSRRRQLVWAFAGGVAAGAATLMRPSWLLFIPFSLPIGFALAFLTHRARECDDQGRCTDRRSAQLRRHGWIAMAMVSGLVLAMSPWWIRNWRITGHFVPTTLQVGESLYDGLGPQATGASNMQFVDRFRRELRTEDARGETSDAEVACFEQRLDDRMKQAAIKWASSHPRRVGELAVIKLLRIWNVWPNEASLRNPVMGLALCSTYVPVLLLALYGACLFLDRGWPYTLCLLPAVYFTCLHMVFVGSIRYRQPAMLPLIAIAAGALVGILDMWKRKREKTAND